MVPGPCRLSSGDAVVRSLVYLALKRVIALMLLCFCSDDAKEVEILVLRHELDVLRRQQPHPRLEPCDRAWLSLLCRLLPRQRWSAFVVRPETLLGWHRRMVARHWTYSNTAKGRPPVASDIQALIVRLATENPRWGYERIKGELAGLGYPVSASSVRRVLRANGIDPAPRRASTTWASFLRRQASGIVACDFFSVDSVWLTRYYVLFFVEIESRRVHVCGITTNPTGPWVTQQARNLAANFEEGGRVVRHLIRDRDTKFTRPFDDVWRSIGARVIPTPVRAPNANAFAERWVGTVRRECFDHLLVVGPRHLARVLDTYVDHYNAHRPHRSLGLVPPEPRSRPPRTTPPSLKHIDRRNVLGGLIHEYDLVA
jgi:putative transposase